MVTDAISDDYLQAFGQPRISDVIIRLKSSNYWETPMPDLLIDGLDPQVLAKLRQRAEKHGRSLEDEIKLILEKEALQCDLEWQGKLDDYRARFRGRRFSDSTELVREDRDR